MGNERRKKNATKIATLRAQIVELQAEFDFFLENSSQSVNPDHDKVLNGLIREINRRKNMIKELSK